MKKLIVIGTAVALLAAACGASGDTSDAATPDGETSKVQESENGGTPSTTGSSQPAAEQPAVTTTGAPADLETLPPLTAAEPKGAATTVPVKPVAVDHPNPLVATALGDLAGRMSVDPADISVVSVEEVTWRDGSLGCPLPGMVYTQALVDGSRIVLSVSGVDYEYHSGGRRDPFYCANPVFPPEGDGGDL